MNYRGGPWTTIFNKATIPYCEFNNFLKFSYKANLFKFSVLQKVARPNPKLEINGPKFFI